MTNLRISDTDREQFINFMMQKGFNRQVRYDAAIYLLKTDWLKPFHTTFYVGYTTDMNQRINGDGYHKGHKDSYQEKWKDATPEYCYQRLQSIAIDEAKIVTMESTPNFHLRIIEEPLTLHNLSTVLSALTELSTKCWLISKGHFADLIEYTQTYNPLFFAAMVKMIDAGKICIS